MRIWNPYAMKGVDNGVEVYGSEGMVQIGRWAGKSGFKVIDRILFDKTNEPDAHVRNFIDCIRSRQLKFDTKTETIVGDAEANRYLKREYRKHWATPRDGARIP